MKKFCSALMIFFALAFLLPQSVFAADVPSFLALDSKNITFALKTSANSAKAIGNKVFGYKCSPNTAEYFAKSYALQLLNNGLFRLSAQFTIKNNDSIFEVIQLKYMGSKKPSTFTGLGSKKCHLEIARDLKLDTVVLISIANGLTYADEVLNAPVVPNIPTKPARTTPVSTNKNVGADVPDFAQVGAYYKKNQLNGDGSTLYFYGAKNLSSDLSNDYVGKYIRLLTNKYHFRQAGYEKKKWGSPRLQKNRPTKFWRFRYTSSKNVWALSNGCHVEIKRIRELDKGIVSFEVKVARGLTMAGNHGSPKASSGGGDTFCSYCSGSGKCTSCGGSGHYNYTIDYQKPCQVCNMSGKCVYCNGTGRA